jgi:ribose transport system substrate-binding protein
MKVIMKNKILSIFVLAAISISILIPGCGTKEPQKPRISLIMKSLANEFFKTMEDGAKAHQKQSGKYELVAEGIKDELDVAKQMDLVEQMIAQKVNAIVIAPADSKAMVSVCKKAQDAGIVVVNIDNKLDEDVLKDKNIKIPFVGPDNRKGAYLAGQYLAKKLQKGNKVAIIEGAPNAFNAVQRKLGFEDAMKEAGIEIATSQSGNWETAKANQIVSAVITEYPNVKAILCANDSMALGAVAALRTAGKTNDVLVVGFDNISAAQRLLKEGKMLCTVDQHADKLAVFGIEYALDILNGKGKAENKETLVDLITAQSLK